MDAVAVSTVIWVSEGKVDAVEVAIVLWVSEGVGEIWDVPVLLWPVVVATLFEADEALDGVNKKPGLVLVVSSFGSVWFTAKILNF